MKPLPWFLGFTLEEEVQLCSGLMALVAAWIFHHFKEIMAPADINNMSNQAASRAQTDTSKSFNNTSVLILFFWEEFIFLTLTNRWQKNIFCPTAPSAACQAIHGPKSQHSPHKHQPWREHWACKLFSSAGAATSVWIRIKCPFLVCDSCFLTLKQLGYIWIHINKLRCFQRCYSISPSSSAIIW